MLSSTACCNRIAAHGHVGASNPLQPSAPAVTAWACLHTTQPTVPEHTYTVAQCTVRALQRPTVRVTYALPSKLPTLSLMATIILCKVHNAQSWQHCVASARHTRRCMQLINAPIAQVLPGSTHEEHRVTDAQEGPELNTTANGRTTPATQPSIQSHIHTALRTMQTTQTTSAVGEPG